jgi:hypothetical protein
MPEEANPDRRRFLGTATIGIAAAQLGMIGVAEAQTSKKKPANVPSIKPGTNTSFSSLKQIDAGLLSVGYAEAGPPDGAAVVLLQGWPYDIHSYVAVAPLLASAGYGTISRSSSGALLHRNGISMTRPSIALLHLSTTRITSAS